MTVSSFIQPLSDSWQECIDLLGIRIMLQQPFAMHNCQEAIEIEAAVIWHIVSIDTGL